MSAAKPSAVFRYSDTEGLGHFFHISLEPRRVPWSLVKPLDRRRRGFPNSSEPFAALAFHGWPD